MKRIIILSILILQQIMLFGQNTFTSDQLAICVVNLRCEIKPGVEETGTGTFIENSAGELFILTASHVAKTMNSKAFIIIKGENGKPIKLKLTDLSKDILWKNHPIADISILKINPPDLIFKKYLQNRFFPTKLINDKVAAISRNTQLTIIGFPLGLGSEGYFSPLTFRTFPSSSLITMKRFDNKIPQTFIILENPSTGGYSGGPVFDLAIIEQGIMTMTTGEGTKLYGIIHGTISDNTGGKLAAITPSFLLFDLINK